MLFLWASFLGLTPLWNSLLFDLEIQIKRSAPDQISRIIALGGAIHELTTDAHDDVTLAYAARRMMATLGLTQLYPNTPAIFTRFSSRLVCGKLSESDVVLPFVNETIRSTERILLENRSRNTIENARYAKELITLGKTGRRLLLASGFRMPRAFEIFSDHQIGIMPYPTDFQSNHSDRGFRWNLTKGATNSRS
ncbi:MAG: YdcF family protein [Pseudomonadota bacterium]|nr:YdcF family protein [Pseudomonadota bacterium]